MDGILGNEGTLVISFPNNQAIFPEVNFICRGSILSWIFGAVWEGNTDSSYRYGDLAVEMESIVKLGALQS